MGHDNRSRIIHIFYHEDHEALIDFQINFQESMESQVLKWRKYMKKTFRILPLVAFCTIVSCGDMSCQEMFSLKSPQLAKGQSAEELIKEISRLEPKVKEKSESPNKLGRLYERLGEKYMETKTWNLAIDSFDKAIGYGRNNPLVYYSLGVCFANKANQTKNREEIDKAEAHYRKALELDPRYDNAAYGLGIMLFYLKDDKESALETMRNLSLRNKNFYRARFAMGRFQYEMGRPEKSLAIYESLFSDPEKEGSSPTINEYKRLCRENIDRLMMELSPKK